MERAFEFNEDDGTRGALTLPVCQACTRSLVSHDWIDQRGLAADDD